MKKLVLKGLRQLELMPAEPVEPPADTGMITAEVVCCAVCRTDAKMWEQGHRDLVFPRVPGHEMVVRDTAGNRFAVWPGKSCGVCRHCRRGRENLCEEMKIAGFHTDGGFADQVTVPRACLVPLPPDLDSRVACFAEPVGCVINAFEKLPADPGQRLLIFGGGTMGLVTALYAKARGYRPLILEKNEAKIRTVQPVLADWDIPIAKETMESEFDLVINACPDPIAFCQAVTKVDKGGHVSFFSGITKNEQVETNLLNQIHYKEAALSGAYGMKQSDMEQAVPFMASHADRLARLIQKTVAPESAPDLMPDVLSGQYLKFILDFSGGFLTDAREMPTAAPAKGQDRGPARAASLWKDSRCARIVEAVRPVTEDRLADATAKIDDKTKPLGALGRIEDLCVRMSLIQDSLNPEIRQKNLFVFAGDHGVTEEGVSAFPAEVTGQMVDNFLSGGAAINVLCRHYGIDLKVVDMGVIKSFSPHPLLERAKVAPGTRNMAIEPAMTRAQALRALEAGMDVFLAAHDRNPVQIVGLGEMGIGNTTAATAIICAVTGIEPADATGRGTGVDNKGLSHKTEVIQRILAFHRPDPADGLGILEAVGGFEIAGIAGACLAAASKGCAVVLDGVISTAAGLLAYLMNPDIGGYLISGHRSVETAQIAALERMDLTPVIDLDMRLGEGTGAALAMDLAETACRIMCEMASFDEAKISRSKLT